MVTPESPEAMEEILWTSFFDDLHNCRTCNVLDERTDHPDFESFYKDHIRKLLLVRKGRRYAAKGNYNLARLSYLLKLFPDARFVVPVRHPRWHVASLKKQHGLFSRAAALYPRSVNYLDRAGHFEFGAHRRPVNHGDDKLVRSIVELWERGDEARGWARYWSHVYGSFFRWLQRHPQAKPAVLAVQYEQLCERPRETLARIAEHCDLSDADALIDRFSGRLHAPTYYVPEFTRAEESAIGEETQEIAALFGYGQSARPDTTLSCLCTSTTQ
jgi:hypothetical protein